MMNAHTPSAHHAQRDADTISIRQRPGIWRLAQNDKFYGDYTRRYWAIEAAFARADAIAKDGGAAIIMIAMDGEQDALLYDTRAPAPREAGKKAAKAKRPRLSGKAYSASGRARLAPHVLVRPAQSRL